ncbi:response regulator [Verrucomicrobiales bacterium]|nr:response regulator [Verrucomicrobiales bacterium]
MNRVLIAAAEVPMAESVQASLSSAGFQTAVVWNASQLLDFCKQHAPDILVIDLDLPGGSVWAAIQAIRALETLQAVPIVGVGESSTQMVLDHARSVGVMKLFPKATVSRVLPMELQGLLNQPIHLQEVRSPAGAIESIAGDTALDRLQTLTSEVIQLADGLKLLVPTFGDDGPELFGYIDNSSVAIREKLGGLSDEGLRDKEIRHDFRNMIGSVTGFAELIMMEESISDDAKSGLTRIRECSRIFVDLLDQQKAEAA